MSDINVIHLSFATYKRLLKSEELVRELAAIGTAEIGPMDARLQALIMAARKLEAHPDAE